MIQNKGLNKHLPESDIYGEIENFMRDKDLLSLAYKIAQEAHRGAVDKGGYDYILHPKGVASMVTETDEKIVALLHDVIEDSDMTLDILRECGFSERILSAVDAISKRREESRKSYLYRVKSNPLARIVKIADLKHNCDLSRIKNPTKRDIIRTQKYENELENNNTETAISLLNKALHFPHNLGEGKLEGQKDNDIYYRLGLAFRRAGKADDAEIAFQKATLGDNEPAGAMYYNDQPADMILYKGLAYRELGEEQAALSCFHKLVDYGEKHLFDEVKIEYFAVSLPELQLFEENLTQRNKIHCTYLIGLGSIGLGELNRAEQCFEEVENKDPAHAGVQLMKKLLNR